MSNQTDWNQRSFVVLGALLSGLALPVTGLLDHAAGGSSSNNAVGWSITHISVSCLFVGFCAWHLVLNRRTLLRYVRAAGGEAEAVRRLPAKETVVAAAVVGGVLLATIVHALADG
jgi:ribose/xylose/arabinose/galactoside ABC-type transport system permease subunit